MKKNNVLDLHGERHAEVDRMIENFVLLNKPPLSIITGNSEYMRSRVKEICEKHKIEYEPWTSGEIKILKW